MSCDCCDADKKRKRMPCPACGRVGFAVGSKTLLHQLCFPDNQKVRYDAYAFCKYSDCDIAYFSDSEYIQRNQLRAFQPKQVPMICYCFDISEASYRTAQANGTAASIKDFVVQQTQSKQCACEVRNPSGRCCLVNF